MKSIFTILQDIEKLIYKVLMWVILAPKTIVKIIVDPGWAPDYVRGELEQKDSPFDDFMSPVILLLVVALIPALAFSFLPTFGSTISSAAEEKPTTDRFLSFNVQTDFRSSSAVMEYLHIWTVERSGADGSLEILAVEHHSIEHPVNYLEVVDNNTVRDQFLYTFNEPGRYYVTVYAEKYVPPLSAGHVADFHYAFLEVNVPVLLEEQIVITNPNAKTTTGTPQNQGIDSFSAQVQKEKTIFLALALMLPPLLFALATKLHLGESISENTLKQNFYVQCYYFSPLSLAIWATYYAFYFYTEDAYFYSGGQLAFQIMLLPPLLAALWFFRTQVNFMGQERKISALGSVLIVVFCIALLGFAANVFFSFQRFQDIVRVVSIRSYPLGAAALIIAFGIGWYTRKLAEKAAIGRSNWAMLALYAIAFFVLLRYFSSITFRDTGEFISIAETQIGEPPADTESATATPSPQETALATPPLSVATATADVSASTNTPETLTEPAFGSTPTETVEAVPLDTPTVVYQPFYTEEFNTDVASWTRFMTSGDERMVEQKVDLGKLSIDLFRLEDRIAWYYLINNDYTYSDVKVEAVVTNRGVNANGVSLICRYSDIGWYEFFFSYSGFYSINAVDRVGIVNLGSNKMFDGGSNMINAGLSTNVFAAECKGTELNLYVNQTLISSVTDTLYNFTQGKIGLAVSSPERLPVSVDFETLTISQP